MNLPCSHTATMVRLLILLNLSVGLPFFYTTAASKPLGSQKLALYSASASLQPEVQLSSSAQGDATSYPTVTAIEHHVFKRTFAEEPISKRLSRLEKSVFGYARNNLPLVDRVDDLLAKYPLASHQASQLAESEVLARKKQPTQNKRRVYSHAQAAKNNQPTASLTAPSIDYIILDNITLLEQKLLPNVHNRPVGSLLVTERLDQLEQEVFHHSFSSEPVQDRLERLKNVNKKLPEGPRVKTGRPETYTAKNKQLHKRQQASAPKTTSNSHTTYSRPTIPKQQHSIVSQKTPQNIQIGTNIKSQSTHQYSSEFLSMLPPSIQQQLASHSAPAIKSTAIQNKNYTGNPLAFSTSPVQQNNPHLEALENLELQMFGESHHNDSELVRLSKLESALLQTVYPELSQATRLKNLQKAMETRNILFNQ